LAPMTRSGTRGSRAGEPKPAMVTSSPASTYEIPSVVLASRFALAVCVSEAPIYPGSCPYYIGPCADIRTLVKQIEYFLGNLQGTTCCLHFCTASGTYDRRTCLSVARGTDSWTI
jgi:hypothetical protein